MAETLGSMTKIAQNIKSATTHAIKSLHHLLFGDEYKDEHPRGNRKRIRQFGGFAFKEDDENYKEKLHSVLTNFSVAQLACISNILSVNFDENKEKMARRILNRLINLSDEVDDDDEEDDENDDYEGGDDEEDDVHQDENNKDGEKDEDNGDQNEIYEEEEAANFPKNPINRTTSKNQTNSQRVRSHVTNFALTFRDVEDTLRNFSGDDSYRIENWFEDLEETSDLMGWSELQKLVFAKKSLTGLAKLYIRGEKHLNTFKKFKTAMLAEFGKKISSAQLHKSLESRKLGKHETVKEYYLHMKEIASQGHVEEDSFMQYVIDGLSDSLGNKAILYGAKSLTEFKEKLDVCQKIQTKNIEGTKARFVAQPIKTQTVKNSKEVIRCFNCGEPGHKSLKCNQKSRGMKCFACNEFGHVSAKCPKKTEMKTGERSTGAKSTEGNLVHTITNQVTTIHNMNKPLKINGSELIAFIDTGSDLNVIRLEEYLNLGAPNFERRVMKLAGFGRSSVVTLGRFKANVEVDDVKFCTEIFIVPDVVTDIPLIIGKPALKEVTITVNSTFLKIAKTIDPEKTILEEAVINSHDDSSTDGQLIETTNREQWQNEICLISVDYDEITIGSPKYADVVKKLIADYEPKDVTPTNVRMKLILTDDDPVSHSPRRLAVPEKIEVDRQIKQWLEEGIIKESSSDFASPIVLVKKSNGEVRICVDYRRLNRKIVKDRYPLPIIEDQLDKLSNANVFTTLDLKNGFFHVPLDEESTKYTSFVTPGGQYEFLRAPFGLCNSPAVFQRFINDVFKDYISQDMVLVYMDDLVIPAADYQEAIVRLQLVLKRAEMHGLNLNWRKCQFLCSHIEYLGHEVENGRINPSKKKIEAVMKFPTPRNIKQVQSFLGLTGYFRKFIKDYALKARPLSDLLKKDRDFKFEEEEQVSFQLLKDSLCAEPVLKIFSFGKETELHTDASKEGYGAILMQRDDVDGRFHPVYYMSRKTSEAEKKYDSYELEVLAIIGALKKFRVYLLGIKFRIITDCLAFTMTMQKKDLVTRVARWSLLLEEFQYEVKHRAGSSMKHCDALSRCPIVMSITSIFLERIKAGQRTDENLVAIVEILNSNPFENFVMKRDIWFKETNGNELLVIPTEMQEDLIRNVHANGHFNTRKV